MNRDSAQFSINQIKIKFFENDQILEWFVHAWRN